MLKEEQEQALFVDWLEMNNLKFTAIPNNTWTTSFNQKRKNKRTGLRPGFPDMIVIVPGADKVHRLICIEMKKAKQIGKKGRPIGGGKLKPHQQEWIIALNKCNDVEAFVCYGFEEAKAVVEEIRSVNQNVL